MEIERRRNTIWEIARRSPEGRVAIVVDDGLATGNTMRVALEAAAAAALEELVMAVPVAPREATRRSFADQADQIVCLATPEPFGAVGYFYSDFSPTERC